MSLRYVFVLMLLFLGVATAQQDTATIDRIDRFLGNLEFSGSVLVAQGDEIIFNQGYGMANREWNIPNTPDTKFRIGPLTMQFTGMAILMLQERGLLTVQDPICDYIEDCPPAWQDITIHHLLTHTSGIPDYFDFSDFDIKQHTTLAQLVERIKAESLDFAPGTEWAYSYSGYILLGHIIGEVSGSTYVTFLRRQLLEPLNLTNTDIDRNVVVIGNRAEGYAGLLPRAEYIDMSNLYSALGIYSTTEDLFRWTQALHNDEVVSQATWEAMWEAAVPMDDSLDTYYAYGLMQDESSISDGTMIGEGGSITGFTSSFRYYVGDDMTIIILGNMQTSLVAQVSSNIHKWLTE